MKNKRIVFLAAAITFGCYAEGLAGTRSGYNSFNFGNSQAGANGTYSVVAENRSNYSRIDLNATGTVKFLNKSAKGVEFTATTENSAGRKSAVYTLQVAGYVVDSGTKSVSYVWSKPINRTLIQTSATVTVGPVPVTISGAVGGGTNIGYTFQLDPAGVGVSGNASAWASGNASAGVGVRGFNVSLRSDLQLAKTSLNPSVRVTPTTWSGSANLVFDPVSINLSIALQTLNRVLYQLNLANYSAPSSTRTLLQL
ncbi:MAG: hypothetical protein FJ145_09040 [Deltaproteobacteria bacterium]|nr:hypothetical protein [Deltaproteobacteria bacterium]